MIKRYFMGTAVDKPASRHMYRVSTELMNDVPQCVTCNTVNADQKECSYNSVEFSTNLRYYVHGCDGPNAPRSVIKESAVRKKASTHWLFRKNLCRPADGQGSLPGDR